MSGEIAPGAMPDSEQALLASVWRERTRKFGGRCVINLNHPPELYDRVTEQQKAILFPLLSRLLNGTERRILDFGCGNGRFSAALHDLLPSGHDTSVLGYDVCQELLDLAPATDGVRFSSDYGRFEDGSYAGSFDLIWLCLVLGGIPDGLCGDIAGRLAESLRPDGLLFLVEHVSRRATSGAFWRFRTLDDYRRMFGGMTLVRIGHYYDFGSRISIVAGAKSPDRLRRIRFLAPVMRARSALFRPKTGA